MESALGLSRLRVDLTQGERPGVVPPNQQQQRQPHHQQQRPHEDPAHLAAPAAAGPGPGEVIAGASSRAVPLKRVSPLAPPPLQASRLDNGQQRRAQHRR